MKRGRPPLAPEDRKPPKPVKNMTVDEDCLVLLHECQQKLADELGFEPTLSMTIKAVVKRFKEGK